MATHFLRRFGSGLLAASTLVLIAASSGAAADGNPLVIGAVNLGTQGGNVTQLHAIDNGPAFYATNQWGNGISAIAYPPYGIGVYGIHQATSGNAPGVRGETASTTGVGVLGVATGSGGGYGVLAQGYYGVAGTTTGGTGYGVIGSASGALGIGVFGSAAATGASAFAIYGNASAPSYAGYFVGNVHATGTFSAPTKNFKIDDPLDPAHRYLVHSSVESSEQTNVYSGNVTTDGKGFATVQLPRWFQVLNKDFRYQLTVVGKAHWDAKAAVWQKVSDNRFTIRADQPNVQVSWQVTGVRHDPYANAHPLRVEQPKAANEQGKYLNPELYGKGKSAGIGYRPLPKPLVQP
jgi:hypothetical protein